MIVSNDIHPQREVYYLGGVILSIFSSFKNDEYDFFSLYQEVNKKEKITINLFALTLDWLFLLGLIDNKKGVIYKCF